MDFPSLSFHNGKCQSYIIHLLYWSEGLIIVNTMNLLKSFANKPGFVFIQVDIGGHPPIPLGPPPLLLSIF
jgi:hypothetical protein